jgi:hypothetical protein
MEIRKHLEVKLLAALKQTTSPHLDLKASKNKLGLLAAKEKLGENRISAGSLLMLCSISRVHPSESRRLYPGC